MPVGIGCFRLDPRDVIYDDQTRRHAPNITGIYQRPDACGTDVSAVSGKSIVAVCLQHTHRGAPAESVSEHLNVQNSTVVDAADEMITDFLVKKEKQVPTA